MKPSSLSTWAMRAFRLVAGMSTVGRSMRLALRTRVSMSAIGSVIMVQSAPRFTRGAPPLPARFHDPGDQAVAGHVAETDPADAELAVDGARAAAQPAAFADADLVARPHRVFDRVLLVLFQGLELALVLDAFGFGGHSQRSEVRGQKS